MGTLGKLKEEMAALRARFLAGPEPDEHLPEVVPVQQVGRVYAVPDGLLPRFFGLYEEMLLAQRIGKGASASYRLWRFLEQRCPEVKQGNWKVDITSATGAEVIEVLS